MIVNSLWDNARAIAQGARHAELSDNRLANKRALVRQFVEEFRQIRFDLECDELRFRGFSRHGVRISD